VIADGPEPPGWPAEVTAAVQEVLAAAGVPPVPDAALLAAFTDRWVSRLTTGDHAELWGEVAGEWPAPSRAALLAHAAVLSRRYMEARHAATWRPRPGMAELLAEAHARGVPVAVVSNTLCAEPHRKFLDRAGLGGRFAAQLYSDEQRVRKPDPEIARRAVAAVRADPAGCWFVGDTRSRDMLVARRAGLGAAVLMHSLRVEEQPYPDGSEPDAEVSDPHQLRALLATCW